MKRFGTGLAALVDKTLVNTVLNQARDNIGPYLKRLENGIRLEVLHLTPAITSSGQRTFSTSFEGHAVAFQTIGAGLGFPLGVGVNLWLDGVEVDSSVAGDFLRNIHLYLEGRYSDTSVLDRVVKICELSERLDK